MSLLSIILIIVGIAVKESHLITWTQKEINSQQNLKMIMCGPACLPNTTPSLISTTTPFPTRTITNNSSSTTRSEITSRPNTSGKTRKITNTTSGGTIEESITNSLDHVPTTDSAKVDIELTSSSSPVTTSQYETEVSNIATFETVTPITSPFTVKPVDNIASTNSRPSSDHTTDTTLSNTFANTKDYISSTVYSNVISTSSPSSIYTSRNDLINNPIEDSAYSIDNASGSTKTNRVSDHNFVTTDNIYSSTISTPITSYITSRTIEAENIYTTSDNTQTATLQNDINDILDSTEKIHVTGDIFSTLSNNYHSTSTVYKDFEEINTEGSTLRYTSTNTLITDNIQTVQSMDDTNANNITENIQTTLEREFNTMETSNIPKTTNSIGETTTISTDTLNTQQNEEVAITSEEFKVSTERQNTPRTINNDPQLPNTVTAIDSINNDNYITTIVSNANVFDSSTESTVFNDFTTIETNQHVIPVNKGKIPNQSTPTTTANENKSKNVVDDVLNHDYVDYTDDYSWEIDDAEYTMQSPVTETNKNTISIISSAISSSKNSQKNYEDLNNGETTNNKLDTSTPHSAQIFSTSPINDNKNLDVTVTESDVMSENTTSSFTEAVSTSTTTASTDTTYTSNSLSISTSSNLLEVIKPLNKSISSTNTLDVANISSHNTSSTTSYKNMVNKSVVNTDISNNDMIVSSTLQPVYYRAQNDEIENTSRGLMPLKTSAAPFITPTNIPIGTEMPLNTKSARDPMTLNKENEIRVISTSYPISTSAYILTHPASTTEFADSSSTSKTETQAQSITEVTASIIGRSIGDNILINESSNITSPIAFSLNDVETPQSISNATVGKMNKRLINARYVLSVRLENTTREPSRMVKPLGVKNSRKQGNRTEEVDGRSTVRRLGLGPNAN